MRDISRCAKPVASAQCRTCLRNPSATKVDSNWQSWIAPIYEPDSGCQSYLRNARIRELKVPDPNAHCNQCLTEWYTPEPLFKQTCPKCGATIIVRA
jgi:hypothetical protein